MASLRCVTHLGVAVDHVMVAAANAVDLDEACLREVGHDPLSGSLGDADVDSQVARTDIGFARDAKQHLRVVGDEAPRLRVPWVSHR